MLKAVQLGTCTRYRLPYSVNSSAREHECKCLLRLGRSLALVGQCPPFWLDKLVVDNFLELTKESLTYSNEGVV